LTSFVLFFEERGSWYMGKNNQHRQWSDKYTEIMKDAILSGKPFTYGQLQEKIDVAPCTLRKYLSTVSRELGIAVSGVSSKDDNKVLQAIQGKAPKSVQDPNAEPKYKKIPKGAEKFMCKCLCDGEVLWVAMIARSKTEAIRFVRQDYTGIKKVLQVYSQIEYSQVRMNRYGRITAGSGLGGNSMSQKAGKTRRLQ
jgi:hypothetical protein